MSVKRGFPALLLAFFAASCNGSREEEVQARVAERVAAYRVKKADECRNALLAEANRLADSLLLAEAQAALHDSLRMRRAGKPFQPPPIVPIDSLQVKPVFE